MARAIDADDQAAFRALLKRLREARRWSQERLALEAECHTSLVSRVEGGSRGVTRELVAKLVAGLALGEGERDALFVAAGYLPPGLARAGGGAAQALALWRALGEDGLTAGARAEVAALVGAALRLGGWPPPDGGTRRGGSGGRGVPGWQGK